MNISCHLLAVLLSITALPVAVAQSAQTPDTAHERLAEVDLTDQIEPAIDPVGADTAATVTVEPAPAPVVISRLQTGQTTRALFQLQASGQAGGPGIPMMGAAANASYTRYMNSFSHPIPEFFDTNVQSGAGGK